MAAGTLGWYGVSSNTVAHPVDDPEATSLARMLAAAEAAGGPGHHFGVLQLPMNLFEAGGILDSNNPPDAPAAAHRSVLELASAAGIGVLVNRPAQRGRGTRDGAAGRLPHPSGQGRRSPAGDRAEAGGRVPAGDRGAPPSGAGQRQAGELPSLGGSARRRPGSRRERDVLGADRVAGPGSHDARGRRPRRRDRGRARPPVERVARPLPARARSAARRVPRGGRQPEPGAEPGHRRRRRSAAPPGAPRRVALAEDALDRSPARPASPRCSSGCAGRRTWRTRPAVLGWPPLPDARPVYEALRSLRLAGA